MCMMYLICDTIINYYLLSYLLTNRYIFSIFAEFKQYVVFESCNEVDDIPVKKYITEKAPLLDIVLNQQICH